MLKGGDAGEVPSTSGKGRLEHTLSVLLLQTGLVGRGAAGLLRLLLLPTSKVPPSCEAGTWPVQDPMRRAVLRTLGNYFPGMLPASIPNTQPPVTTIAAIPISQI